MSWHVDLEFRGARRVPDCTAWLPVCDAQGKVQFVCQSCASDSSRFEQVAKRQRTIQSTGGGGGGGGGGRRSWPNAAAAGFAVLASVMCLVVSDSSPRSWTLFLFIIQPDGVLLAPDGLSTIRMALL